MTDAEARGIVESLRRGLPPAGRVREYTVGRREEIRELEDRLAAHSTGALLLKANYGSGKTHLLKFIRETALEHGYAVSSLSLDARGGVRFNRMDQIFGAVCRGLEVPRRPGETGVAPFFDEVSAALRSAKGQGATPANRLTDWGRWRSSSLLASDALFIAVRGWFFSDDRQENRALIEDWLYNPGSYGQSARSRLYFKLVERLRPCFRDERSERQFYADDVFNFWYGGYRQSWDALGDLSTLADAAGLRGLVLLFDEFEDVITNLRRIDYQERAFSNLFRFFSGQDFGGSSFFAVTPEFVVKCKTLLLAKGKWDYDFSAFDALPAFEMSPLTIDELDDLALRIMQTHSAAYGWDCCGDGVVADVEVAVAEAMSVPVQDRVRQAIKAIVGTLDDHLDAVGS